MLKENKQKDWRQNKGEIAETLEMETDLRRNIEEISLERLENN